MNLKLVSIFFGLLFTLSLANKKPECESLNWITRKLSGQCPQIKYRGNVTFEKAVGFYFQPYSTVNLTEVGCDSACVTTRITPKDETAFKLEICCRKGCGIQCGPKVGSGTVAYHPTVVSTASYSFKDTCGRPRSLQMFVLDTDNFETYFIAYACESSGRGLKEEHVYVSTKEQNLSEELIGHIFEVLNENGVDVTKIIFSPQYKECPYAYYD